ncbi:MAG: ABC transporter ATP-binding protein/permease [Defluviitaleaceae bacterium]|nr:ABC transporter ATP-binding protein/permease [Defluviitaleaceae bacterium]
MILSLVSTAIGILSPYIIGAFLDSLIYGGDINVVLSFAAIFGGLNIVKILKGYITSIMYIKIKTKMSYDLNSDAIKHIQSLSLSYINQNNSAYLNHRLNLDSNEIITFCITIIQSIATNAIMLIVPFAILLYMNFFMALMLIGFLVFYVILYLAFKGPLYKASLAIKEFQNKFFSSLFEQLKYIKFIKTNSIHEEMNMRMDKDFVLYRNSAIHMQKVSYLYSGLDGFVSTLAQIVLFVAGGYQILIGSFTVGMFTIFISYFSMMLGAGRYFFGLGANYQQTLVALDRIKDIFTQEIESCGDKILEDIWRIELHNVSFSYISSDNDESSCNKKTINNFNAIFEKGKIYGITGKNGAGKSTLINLIIGMYINEFKGSIAYNDIDIRNINMQETRKTLFGLSDQEPVLMNDTIRYNLTFGRADDTKQSNLDQQQILDAHIKTLNMTDFITNNTLDLTINDKNTSTSGGEKQKISILKVLMKNPAVMIFDEPTSALDRQTSEQFMEYLRQIKRDKIIILITHDNNAEVLCDEMLEITGC